MSGWTTFNIGYCALSTAGFVAAFFIDGSLINVGMAAFCATGAFVIWLANWL